MNCPTGFLHSNPCMITPILRIIARGVFGRRNTAGGVPLFYRTAYITMFHSQASGAASPSKPNITDMRVSYNPGENLDFCNLVSKEPMRQFEKWFDDARQSGKILEANAMAVATATSAGVPAVRMCLLKGFDKSGFKFFTNYGSRKGKEIAANNNVALMFYWEPLARSVRIDGTAVKMSEAESDEYFHSRPRGSQIGACVSEQSSVVASRTVLEEKYRELEQKYSDETVPIERPRHWGGYLVQPYRVEFWEGQQNRLHDRIVFRKPTGEDTVDGLLLHQGEDGWVYERLSP